MREPDATSESVRTRSGPSTHVIDPDVLARRWVILGVLCLSLVLVVASVSSVNVAIPTLGRDLGASDTELLWIIDAYALVFAGLLLPAGALGDRFGRKGALQLGLATFAIASSLCAFTSSPAALIACRSVMGVGAALIMPSTLSLLANVFPPNERGKAIAIWAGFAGAGGAIGPVMGGLLLGRFYWGSVFFVAVPIALTALALITLLAPSSRELHAGRLDPVGALLSIIGFSVLLFAIIEGPELGWFALVTVLAFAVSAACLIGFIRYEQRSDHPMLDMAYFAKRPFSMGSFGITFVFLSMFSLFFALTQYLQFVKGYSPLEAGVRGLPFAATMIVLAPRSVAIGRAVGAKRMVVAGMGSMVVGLLLLSLSGTGTPYWRVAICLVIVAIGPALAMPTLTGGILSSVPIQKSGVGSAVNDTTREVGGAIGIAVIGTIVSSIYRSRLADALGGLPADVVERAEDSAGKAFGAAEQLAAQGDTETAGRIIEAVRNSFADAFQIGLRISALITLAAVLVMAWRFPAEQGPSEQVH
jgi:EmrB/QacA subfamily drug resistance transporter